jgi:hypothetical protein
MGSKFEVSSLPGRFFDPLTGAGRISRDNAHEVMTEVKKNVLLMFSRFDFSQINQIFQDIVRLFDGNYPGYGRCNTRYHDLDHTMDCLLVTAKLIHGASVNGFFFEPRDVNLGLITAFMHDTGYIQAVDDAAGTGGKYTLCHIERSIDFMAKYFQEHGFPADYLPTCSNFLRCTGLDVHISDINFATREQEILGKIIGAADLIGQMADEYYLEKLPFLYQEFKEGGVPGYEDEYDLLKKTPGFWEMIQKRFATELGQVDLFLRGHFRVRWGIDQDLYRMAIERNIDRLKTLLGKSEAPYPGWSGRLQSLGVPLD